MHVCALLGPEILRAEAVKGLTAGASPHDHAAKRLCRYSCRLITAVYVLFYCILVGRVAY